MQSQVSLEFDRSVPVLKIDHLVYRWPQASHDTLRIDELSLARGERLFLYGSSGLTREEALKASTVNAAYVLGIDHDLGSIQSGKLADFAVLEADPTEVPVDQLKDIKVWGVVFEGEVHKAKN